MTAYIVDGIDPSKLENILEISIEQFHLNSFIQIYTDKMYSRLRNRAATLIIGNRFLI